MFRSPHVRLLVSDFPACFRFYQDTLGLTPRFNLEDVYAEFDISGQTLALYHRNLMAEAVGAAAKPALADAQDRVCSHLRNGRRRQSRRRAARAGRGPGNGAAGPARMGRPHRSLS